MVLPADIATIGKIKQIDKSIYIDGVVEEKFLWNTTVERRNNFATPDEIIDYSKERSWVQAQIAAGNLLKNMEKGVKFEFKPELCEENLEFRVWGNFSSKRLEVNKPVIKAIVDKDNIAFRWVFYKGGLIGDDDDLTDEFTVNAIVDGEANPVVQVPLPDLDLKTSLNFTLMLDCPNRPNIGQKFEVTLNNEWTGVISLNKTWINKIHTLQLSGGLSIDTAAYMGTPEDSCLTLAPNGRVVPQYDQNCQQWRPTVCEHQFCYTRDGFDCILPFKYKDITYRNCSSQDLFKPWCPTAVDSAGEILDWGFCLEDCPFEAPAPSCLYPPPIPTFATPGTTEVNYS